MRQIKGLKPAAMRRLALSQTLILGLACLALLASQGFSTLREYSRKTRADLTGASKAFTLAIADTRQQLALMMHDVTSDKLLLQNMNWGYSNSVTQALQSRLRVGELEQLEIFDAQCKSLARVHQRTSLPGSCDTAATGQFVWSKNPADQTAVLSLTFVFGEAPKGPYKVMGAVNLSDQWLSIQSELRSAANVAGVLITPPGDPLPSKKVISTEGTDSTGQPTIAMVATAARFVPWVAQPVVAETARRLQTLTIITAIGLLFFGWLRQKRHLHRLKTEFATFSDWVSELSSDPLKSGTDANPLSTSLLWRPEFKDLKDQLSSFLDRLADKKHVVEKEREEISALLAERDDLLLRCRHRLAELSELNTLGEQLKRTTRAFAAHVHDIHDAFEDLQSILSSGLRHESRQLVRLADRWVSGLRERGARKFIRSLAETAGSTPEKSALDDEINDLQSTSQAITDLSLSAAMHAQKLVQSVEHTAEVASMWDKLSHRNPSEESVASWKDITTGLQRLMKMDAKLAPLNIADYLGEAESAAIPKLPASVWTSTLYHICLAAFDSRWIEKFSIEPMLAFRMRLTPARAILVISVRLPEATPLLTPSTEQNYHLDIAQALLEPYGLEAAPMAVVRGAAPIAISWTPATVSVTPATVSVTPMTSIATATDPTAGDDRRV